MYVLHVLYMYAHVYNRLSVYCLCPGICGGDHHCSESARRQPGENV